MQAWKAIKDMFSSQTCVRSINIRIALASIRKGNMFVAEYVGKMRSLCDEMASTSKPLDDEEILSYNLTGLDIKFNPIVSAIVARVEPITLTELYAQLLSFETRMNLLQGSS